MKHLREAVREYVSLRRGLGFKLKKHQRFLQDFVVFLEQNDTRQITARLALQWATQPQHLHPSEWAARLSVVRGFARYWSAFDETTEIPPTGLLPFRPDRARPYFYSEEEVVQLLKAAKDMRPVYRLQPWTFHCLFGLLAVTGLRISEALNLRLEHVDWAEGILTIHGTKFGKSRLVPLHPSSFQVLCDYASRRKHLPTKRDAGYLFPSSRGARLNESEVRRTFYRLSRQIGIRDAVASTGPRLHDFRHRFAVKTLLQWHRQGQDVRRRLPALSTYLGHGHVSDTYWYVTSTPELMELIGAQLEKRWEAGE